MPLLVHVLPLHRRSSDGMLNVYEWFREMTGTLGRAWVLSPPYEKCNAAVEDVVTLHLPSFDTLMLFITLIGCSDYYMLIINPAAVSVSSSTSSTKKSIQSPWRHCTFGGSVHVSVPVYGLPINEVGIRALLWTNPRKIRQGLLRKSLLSYSYRITVVAGRPFSVCIRMLRPPLKVSATCDPLLFLSLFASSALQDEWWC